MVELGEAEQPLGPVGAPPLAGRIFVRLGHGRVGVDGGQDPAEAELVAHRQDDLGEHLARSRRDDRGAEDAVRSRGRQQLDEAAGRALGDRSVEMGEVEAHDLIGDARFARGSFVMADMGDFGVGERHPGEG